MARKSDLLKNKLSAGRNAIVKLPETITERYISKLDYSKYGVSKEDEEILKEKESMLMFSRNEIIKNLSVQCRIFYECQKLFSRQAGGDGTFITWFTDLGFSKSHVYRCLNTQSLVDTYGIQDIYDATVNVRTIIFKNKENLSDTELKDVFNSPNPELRLKEILKSKEQSEEVEILEPVDELETYKIKAKELTNTVKLMKEDLFKMKEKIKELKEEYDEMRSEYSKTKTELDNAKKIIKISKN